MREMINSNLHTDEYEANFGLSCIADYLSNDSENFNVLEIGCGTGILLSKIAKEYSNISFEGIEPFNQGFEEKAKFFKDLNNQNLIIHNVGYEKFLANKKFDLIYSINVFEHIKNWKDFLIVVPKLLKEGGKCIIVCPNYNFPYE